MTKPVVLGARAYAKLVKDAGAILARGQADAEAAVSNVRVQTYWALGRRVLQEGLSQRAGYGDGIVQELALDLGLSRALMFQVVAFARTYPRRPRPGLSWSQYATLLSLKDDGARAEYEVMARQQKLTTRALQQAVSGRVLRADAKATAPGVPRPRAADHVYTVQVGRVIDGDTLEVEIDLGFDVIRRQKLRLALVDAPVASGKDGRAATRFVRERLARAEHVVVKTVRTADPHGRYVGHLFYATVPATLDEVFRQGTHLNAELVKKGLATVVPGAN